MASGIWQPNDEHKLTSTLDYYHKTNHTHFDSWDSSGNSIIGDANQTSQTRRWGISLKDDWTPMNDYLDSMSTKVYYQHTEAHDWTRMPDSTARAMETVNSNYDTDTGHSDRAGEIHWSPRPERRTQRQHHQNPAPVQPVAGPEHLQRNHAAGSRQPGLHSGRLRSG